eukprot:CAMPEP_0170635088 /NCGR_PEP_ID=MMETSP0224-20130122/37011_1 /TAXON_ID=285029 /ORGANISM="Togula jolla, Strain CCCM 725" /LENGTH=86 /DNA_ID=CAMNT_0010964517 /DNA_START=155 /DNA_END=415 /DNA_ORIENTATION=+
MSQHNPSLLETNSPARLGSTPPELQGGRCQLLKKVNDPARNLVNRTSDDQLPLANFLHDPLILRKQLQLRVDTHASGLTIPGTVIL